MHIGRTRSVSGIGALSAVCVTGTVLAVTLLAGIGSANADTLKLFSGGAIPGATGPGFTTNATSVYTNIIGTDTACSGGGAGDCSGNTDVHATTITLPGGVTATGSGPAIGGSPAGAWYDLQPNYGGMGVGPLNGDPSDADQITFGETLTIKFLTPVALTGVATLFSDDHTPFGGSFPTGADVGIGNTFLLNGQPIAFSLVNQGLFDFGVHDTWTFAAMENQPDFYVSGLTWIGGQITNETPLPAAVWLFGGGLGLVAMLSGRRKRKQKSVWETTTSA